MRFVHAADIHLDSPLTGLDRYEGAPVDEFRSATRGALQNLVKLCIEEGAKLLLIAGDLYDGGWPDYNTGLFFAKQMAKLRDAGVRVAVIAGNHDAASVITRTLPWPENVHVFSTKKPETWALDDLGVVIHGQGFATRKVTEDLAAAYPDPVAGVLNIGLLHTALDGRAGHDTYAPTTADALARKGYAYWALGHVHAREIVREDPWVVFPGNLQGRHIRETGAKGAMVVDVKGTKIASVEHRALDVVRWAMCEVDASPAKTEDDVLGLVEEKLLATSEAAEGRPVAARVHVFGASDAHAAIRGDVDDFESKTRAIGIRVGDLWVEKVIVRTKPRADAGAGSEAAQLLAKEIAGLRGSPELAQILERIREKLPAELRQTLDDPAALLDDAEAILVSKLYEET